MKKSQTPKDFVSEKLSKQNVKDEYIIMLQNRFSVLQDHKEIEEQWKMISESIREGEKMTIGRRRGTHKEQWIQDDTWTLIDERKQAKIMREQAKSESEKGECCIKYRELDKKVKSKWRYDKKIVGNERKEAQDAADKNDPKTLCKIVKDL